MEDSIPCAFPLEVTDRAAEKAIREKIYKVLEQDVTEMGEPNVNAPHFSKLFWLLDIHLTPKEKAGPATPASYDKLPWSHSRLPYWHIDHVHALLENLREATQLPLKAFAKRKDTDVYYALNSPDEMSDLLEEELEAFGDNKKRPARYAFDTLVVGVPLLANAFSRSEGPFFSEMLSTEELRQLFATIKRILSRSANITLSHQTPPAEAAERASVMADMLPYFEFDPTILLRFDAMPMDKVYDMMTSAGFHYSGGAAASSAHDHDDHEECGCSEDEEEEDGPTEPGYVYLFPTRLEEHMDPTGEDEQVLQEGSVEDEEMEDVDFTDKLDATGILDCHVHESENGAFATGVRLSFPFPHASLPHCALTAMQETTAYLEKRLADRHVSIEMPATSLPEELLQLIGSSPPSKLNAKQRQKARKRAEKATGAAPSEAGSLEGGWRDEMKVLKWKITQCLRLMREKGDFVGGGDEDLCSVL